MPMGFADVATVLFSKFINLDPLNPDWPDRDRFILLWTWFNADLCT